MTSAMTTRFAALALALATGLAYGEEVDEVALDEAPSATATPLPGPQPSPTAPATVAPTPAPTQAGPQASPTAGLGEPGFDRASAQSPSPSNDASKASEDDEGLVIIAPGASSPEDTLESFGIDSPFNWRGRGRGRKDMDAPAGTREGPEGEEAIEINAPESSDFRSGEKVDVESAGRSQSAENYDHVEKAGFVVSGSDSSFDLVVAAEKNKKTLFARGAVFYASAEPGRQVYPGSVYTVFRDMGKVSSGPERRELGIAIRAVGVAKVIRVDSEAILMRVEKQYDALRPGDRLRLRDPDRARHFGSLRQASGEAAPSALTGMVAAPQQLQESARAGQYVYLDFGRGQGLTPGMRLAVYRDQVPVTDNLNEVPGPTGKVGELEVVSVQRHTATARVTKSVIGLQAGDRVRNR